MKKLFLLTPFLYNITFNNLANAAGGGYDLDSLGLSKEEQKQLSLMDSSFSIEGEYIFTILINGKYFGKDVVSFESNPEINGAVSPIVKKDFFLKLRSIESLHNYLLKKKRISLNELKKNFNGVKYDLDYQSSTINIILPHNLLRESNIPLPSELDYGVASAYSNISANGSETKFKNNNSNVNNNFLSLQSGINFNKFRLHSQLYLNRTNNIQNHYFGQNWLSYDMEKYKSRIYAGELTSTPGLFDSFEYNGLRISKASEMLDDTQNSYLPEISGVAESNATVQILQNGIVKYQSYVSPGFFSLRDIYLNQTNDLVLRIIEANGQIKESVITVPSESDMMRKGNTYYSFESGLLPKKIFKTNRGFLKFDYKLGLILNSTLKTGAIISEDYKNFSLSLIKDMSNFGAFEVQTNTSNVINNNNEEKKGEKSTIKYDKRLSSLGSFLTILHSENSGDYNEVNDLYYDLNFMQKSKNKISLSHSIKTGGNISFSYEDRKLKSNSNRVVYYTATISKPFFKSNIYATISKMQYDYNKNRNNSQTTFSIGLSIPFSAFSSASTGQITETYTKVDSSSAINTSLSHSALNGDLSMSESYTRAASDKSDDDSNNYSFTGTYHSSVGDFGYGYNKNGRISNQKNWSWRNAFVLHKDGFTFSPKFINPNSGTALIKVGNAKGVMVQSNKQIVTDSHGYAIISNIRPYRYSPITISSTSSLNNVELENVKNLVTPTQGAIVLTTFNAKIGYKILLRLKLDNSFLPYGSYVEGNKLAVANENGYIYLSGVEPGQTVKIMLPNNRKCQYKIPTLDQEKKELNIISGTCQSINK